MSLTASARVDLSLTPRAPRRLLGGRSSFRPLLVVANGCRFRQRSLSFARVRVGRAGVASRMRDVGSPLVACRRNVVHGVRSCRLVVRDTCAATIARRALVVSTMTRGGQRVSFSAEVTVVRARACRSSRRRLSHERRRLSTRCMSTACRSRRPLVSTRRSRHVRLDGRSAGARRFDHNPPWRHEARSERPFACNVALADAARDRHQALCRLICTEWCRLR